MELEVVQPHDCTETPAQGQARIQAAVSRRVTEACTRVVEAGRSFLGPKQVLKMPLERCARSFARRRKRRPRFAARNEAQPMARVRRHKAFQAADRVALKAWKQGHRLVAFPQGTWWMRGHHHAKMTPLIVSS